MDRISQHTVKQISQLKTLGMGQPRRLAWLPKTQDLIVATMMGVWRFRIGEEVLAVQQYGSERDLIECFTLSGEGRVLSFGGGLSQSLSVWDASTGRQLASFDVEHGNLRSLSLNPTGTVLAATQRQDQGTSLILWDVATNQIIDVHPYQDTGSGVWQRSHAFSPSGKHMAYPAADGSIVLLETENWSASLTLDLTSAEVSDVAFNPQETLLAAAGPDFGVVVWSIDKSSSDYGSMVFQLDTRKVGRIAFDGRGEKIALATFGRKVYGWDILIYDASMWQESFAISDVVGSFQGMDLGSRNSLLACTSLKSEVQIWDLENGTRTRTLSNHKWGRVESVRFSADGGLLASASLNDQTVRIWEMERFKERSTIRGFSSFSHSLSFARTLPYLALKEGNDIARVWNLDTDELVLDSWGRGDGRFLGVAISHDGKLIGQRRSSTVTVSEVPSGRIYLEIKKQKSRPQRHLISFNSDDSLVAFDGKNMAIPVWKVQEKEQLCLLDHRSYGWPAALAFGHQPHILAVSTYSSVLIWDLEHVKIIARRDLGSESPAAFLRFSPSQERLLIADRHGKIPVEIWNWNTDEVQRSTTTLREPFASSSDFTLFVAANSEGLIQFWDIRADKLLHEVRGGRRFSIRDIELSQDERLLAVTRDAVVDLYAVHQNQP